MKNLSKILRSTRGPIIWHWNSGQTAAVNIERYWESCMGSCNSRPPNTNPQNWGSQNCAFQLQPYGSRLSNTLIDMHCEVIAIANAPKYSMDSHCVWRLQNLFATSATLIQQFMGFSCCCCCCCCSVSRVYKKTFFLHLCVLWPPCIILWFSWHYLYFLLWYRNINSIVTGSAVWWPNWNWRKWCHIEWRTESTCITRSSCLPGLSSV